MAETDHVRQGGSTTHRLVTAALGMVFAIVAIAVVLVSELTLGPVLAAIAIGILGLDAMLSAYRDVASLLSRIGPLP